jgi:hypothetical protein
MGGIGVSGATANATQAVSGALPVLWAKQGIRSLVDAPCGDCNWMSRIATSLENYLGVDIVPQLIEGNRRRHPHLQFYLADLTHDPLPRPTPFTAGTVFNTSLRAASKAR